VPRRRRARWPLGLGLLVAGVLGVAGALYAVEQADSTPGSPPVVPATTTLPTAVATTAAPPTSVAPPPTTVAPTTVPAATPAANHPGPKGKKKGHG
jgi:hypothetical protein